MDKCRQRMFKIEDLGAFREAPRVAGFGAPPRNCDGGLRYGGQPKLLEGMASPPGISGAMARELLTHCSIIDAILEGKLLQALSAYRG